MDNWADILKSIDTPIQLVGLCILALFVLALMFLRKADGGHRTFIFGLLIFALVGFASLIVVTTMKPSVSTGKTTAAKTNVTVTNTPASAISSRTDATHLPVRDHRANEPVVVRDHRTNPDRVNCAVVTGLTTGDPFLNVRVNANSSSNLKDRLRNGQRLDVFAKNGNWYNVEFTKSGRKNDGWVFARWVKIVAC